MSKKSLKGTEPAKKTGRSDYSRERCPEHVSTIDVLEDSILTYLGKSWKNWKKTHKSYQLQE